MAAATTAAANGTAAAPPAGAAAGVPAAAGASGANANANTAAAASSSSSSATVGAAREVASLAPPQSLEEANARYSVLKNSVRSGLARKRQIDRALIDLESRIYTFEGSYLANTAASGGNIVKGFDTYLKSHQPANASLAAIARGSGGAGTGAEVNPEDRIFSNSSSTFERSVELAAALAEEDLRHPPPHAHSAAGTPTGGAGDAGKEIGRHASKASAASGERGTATPPPHGAGGGGGGKASPADGGNSKTGKAPSKLKRKLDEPGAGGKGASGAGGKYKKKKGNAGDD